MVRTIKVENGLYLQRCNEHNTRWMFYRVVNEAGDILKESRQQLVCERFIKEKANANN